MAATFFHLFIAVTVSSIGIFYENANATSMPESAKFHIQSDRSTSRVLSRRKRYLTFPDGSSFQLVFCTQTHGYLQIGDIVWFGSTAALAWELPSDPELFSIFKDQEKGLTSNRRADIKNVIYYLDERGKIIDKVPYKRRMIVNPAFAKRSVDNVQTMKDVNATRAFTKKMHALQRNEDFLKLWSDNNIEFHRHGRKNLYEKLETLFKALGWNGRECVLRMLCETGQNEKQQGTFLAEIVRATFTLPKGREFETDVHKAYDVAHGHQQDCSKLYPDCESLYGLKLYDMLEKQ